MTSWEPVVGLETRYSDAEAAALYDVLNASEIDHDFYLELVMEAPAVVDVGCGTGRLLHRARDAGHTGRLCGVDPDPAMLCVARRRADVEWIPGRAASMRFTREFDLAVMTGHAFQCLVGDDEIQASLLAIRDSLVDDGWFAFETRHPAARAWESWPVIRLEAVDPSGRTVRVSYDVEEVAGDVVTFAEITSDASGTPIRVDRASLRFLGVAELDGFLTAAGFAVGARYGGWRREPLGPASEEIITVARRAGGGA